MNDSDKKAFQLLLNVMQDCFKLPHFDVEILRLWWSKLKTLSVDELQTKIDVFIELNNRPPTLDDLISNKPLVTIKSRNTHLKLEEDRARAKELVRFIKNLNNR